MAIGNSGTMAKITGDFSDELPEAGYRVTAKALKQNVWKIVVNLIKEDAKGEQKKDNTIRSFLLSVNEPVGELVVGFVLASAFEFIPTPASVQDVRRRLAYNLRIEAYQDLGNSMLDQAIKYFMTLIQSEKGKKAITDVTQEMQRALEQARAITIALGLATGSRDSPETSGQADEARSPEHAEKANEVAA